MMVKIKLTLILYLLINIWSTSFGILLGKTLSVLQKYPFLILPGFGNDAVDYINPLNQGTEFGFVSSLIDAGVEKVEVVNIKRYDWLKIVGSIGSKEFWSEECVPNKLFQFYFDSVESSVKALVTKYNSKVVLIGHSAGGWLARGLMADGIWKGQSNDDNVLTSNYIAGLVSLGSPHYPPLNGSDMTRGCLKYINSRYPGAYLKEKCKIFYVTVGGTAVTGDYSAPQKSAELFASKSYFQLTGNEFNKGNEIGDGIVPLSYSRLEGAENIIIPGGWHSIQAPDNYWYGGPKVIPQWLPKTVSCLEKYDIQAKKKGIW
jgi:pimeloyl-ACP methyl ester carboxylesterase